MALASISREAQSVSRKLGLTSDLGMIDRVWTLEVGSMADSARIVAIDNSALVIEVDSHAVMQEISLRRKELLRKMNRHFPGPILKQISVRIAQTHGR